METGLYLIVSLESSRRTNERSHRFQLMTFRLCFGSTDKCSIYVKEFGQEDCANAGFRGVATLSATNIPLHYTYWNIDVLSKVEVKRFSLI